MKDREVLYTATGNIDDVMGIKAVVDENPEEKGEDRLRFLFTDTEICFNTEIRKDLREHQLPAIELAARKKDPFMIVVHYLRPKVKAELRKRKIAYLEKNGNLFIHHQGVFVLIEAKKPVNLAKETGNRAFTKTGLKVVYLYLTAEEWLNKPQRAIARQTGTGLGNINNVNHGLEKEGFLLQINKDEKRLQNKKELLEKWMNGYTVNLKPALRLGRFRFLHENDYINWGKLTIDHLNTWWGGEPAGAILTNYLQPGELTLYTTRNRNELMKDYKLVPDQNGNITAYTPFWTGEETPQYQNTVHPLLVYADLMNTGDNRCCETARIVWDKYLDHEF